MVYNINFSGRDVNGHPFHDNVDVTDGNESIRNTVTLSQLLSNLPMNRARYYYDENLKVKIMPNNNGYKLDNIWNKLVEMGENKPTSGDKNMKIYIDLSPELIDLGDKIKKNRKKKHTKKKKNKKKHTKKKKNKKKHTKKKKNKKN